MQIFYYNDTMEVIMKQRLYRSTTDRKLAGVCGGIAEYFETDPTIIRLIVAAAVLISWGTALFIYIIAGLIIPETPSVNMSDIRNQAVDAEIVKHEEKEEASQEQSSGIDLSKKDKE